MRRLTPEECELIAGGLQMQSSYYDEPGDIVVTGSPPPYNPPDFPPPYQPGVGPGTYPPYGGGPTPAPPPPTDDHCSDQEAMQGADEIESKGDDQSKEYGSLVYTTPDGKTLHSPPLGGTGDSTQLSTLNNWLSANGIGWSQVVGFVHNHPATVYGQTSDEAAANRYPSNANTSPSGSGDRAFAHYAVGQGAPADKFSLYINDTRGTLREFTFADRALYENMTAQQMVNGSNLPSTTKACGS